MAHPLFQVVIVQEPDRQLVSRHGYEARCHKAEAKAKLLLNHEAEAEAEALTHVWW